MATADSLTPPSPVLVPRYVRVLEEYGRAHGMTPGEIEISAGARRHDRADSCYLTGFWTGPREAILALGWAVPSFQFPLARGSWKKVALKAVAPIHGADVWSEEDAHHLRIQFGRAPLSIEPQGDLEFLDLGGGRTAIHGSAQLIMIDGAPAAKRRCRYWFNGEQYWHKAVLPDGSVVVDHYTQRTVWQEELTSWREERKRRAGWAPGVEYCDSRIRHLQMLLAPNLRLVVDNTQGGAA